jgi:tRNA(adenine34) deaminase
VDAALGPGLIGVANGMSDDVEFMGQALVQARRAQAQGEVPVGAVVVKDGEVIAVGCNASISGSDPTAHAEIVALRQAAQVLGNYRLDGCELFVTLEPCAMCSGAVLHSRLKRLVFGASDAKTGAAGSVLNLFAEEGLNHHTAVVPGVLADECAALLKHFFQDRRQADAGTALRQDALRTDETRFAGLYGYPWPPRYVNDLPALDGLRLHYLDEGPRDALTTYLCVHGRGDWSYVFCRFIAEKTDAGARVIAPDLIGFGKSDKPKRDSFHQPAWHRQTLEELLQRLCIEDAVLVLWPNDDPLGLVTGGQSRLAGATQLQWLTLSDDDSAALPKQSRYETLALSAPFPDRGHQAAIRAFALRPFCGVKP